MDNIADKAVLINQRKSLIKNEYIEKYLAETNLDFAATLDAEKSYSSADYVVIVAPTNYDFATRHFDA